MTSRWESQLERWCHAGLIEPATADAIRAWEQAQPGPQRLRMPVVVAIALGGVLVAAGLLLFVSTHWEALAPEPRFALLLALVVGLAVAAGGPLLLGWWLRGSRIARLGVAIGWLLVSLATGGSERFQPSLFSYLWWVVGGLLLLAWGWPRAAASASISGRSSSPSTCWPSRWPR